MGLSFRMGLSFCGSIQSGVGRRGNSQQVSAAGSFLTITRGEFGNISTTSCKGTGSVGWEADETGWFRFRCHISVGDWATLASTFLSLLSTSLDLGILVLPYYFEIPCESLTPRQLLSFFFLSNERPLWMKRDDDQWG